MKINKIFRLKYVFYCLTLSLRAWFGKFSWVILAHSGSYYLSPADVHVDDTLITRNDQAKITHTKKYERFGLSPSFLGIEFATV